MLSSGIILSLEVFLPFFILAAWLFIGSVATFILWKDADLFSKHRWKDAKYDQIVQIFLLTVLFIILPPIPIYMAWRDGLFSKKD